MRTGACPPVVVDAHQIASTLSALAGQINAAGAAAAATRRSTGPWLPLATPHSFVFYTNDNGHEF